MNGAITEIKHPMESSIYTAIDANINRSLEGIRVCEDIFRFIARNSAISLQLKEIRHSIVKEIKLISSSDLMLGRDVDKDYPKYTDLKSEQTRESFIDLTKSNLHRAMEAIRSIEEFYKLLNPGIDQNPFEKIRFSLYSIEKDMISFLSREDKRKRFYSSLYAILDSSFVQNEGYCKTTQRLIQGGASIIQLRMKDHSMRKILETAQEISFICRENDVLFIVNDYPEIAYLSNADGVHLGQDDFPVKNARDILPIDKIIGVSTHSIEQAETEAEYGPDYIAIGPVFDTMTKYNKLMKGIGLDVVKEIISRINIPVVVIGGINPARINALKKIKCDCFALVSYLYKDDKIEENCKKIINCL